MVLKMLGGKVTVHYSRWDSWKYAGIRRYWDGRLVYVHVGRFSVMILLG